MSSHRFSIGAAEGFTLLLALLLTGVVVAGGAAVNRGEARSESLATLLARVRPLQPDPGLLTEPDPNEQLWPRNASGLTYGTPTETIRGYHEPDLIQVEATNGRVGYVYRSDLDRQQPASPVEALTWQVEHTGMRVVIPVYESDGQTRVGGFVARDAQ